MKNRLSTLLFAIFLLGNSYCFAQMATISGRIRNFKNQIQVFDASEFQYLNDQASNQVFLPDSNGNFSIKIPLDHPGYFKISRNVIYMSPGDHITCDIDDEWPNLSTFSGKGALVDNFLKNTPFPHIGSFLTYGSIIMPKPQATLDSILFRAKIRWKELSGLKNVTPEFKRLETERVKYDIINSILDFYVYVKFDTTKTKAYIDEFRSRSAATLQRYTPKIADPSLLQLEIYRGLVPEFVDKMHYNAGLVKVRDWIAVTKLIDTINQAHDKNRLTSVKIELNKIHTRPYRQAGINYLNNKLKFGAGDNAVDIIATDVNGEHVKLSDLKGKVIYIDLWATWCGGCMEEMPKFELLKKKFKDDKNVVFISISIDDNVAFWKNSIAKREADGYQWRISRYDLKAYNIVTIPRAIIIDRNFKIVDLNGGLPSYRSLPAQLKQLAGQD